MYDDYDSSGYGYAMGGYSYGAAPPDPAILAALDEQMLRDRGLILKANRDAMSPGGAPGGVPIGEIPWSVGDPRHSEAQPRFEVPWYAKIGASVTGMAVGAMIGGFAAVALGASAWIGAVIGAVVLGGIVAALMAWLG